MRFVSLALLSAFALTTTTTTVLGADDVAADHHLDVFPSVDVARVAGAAAAATASASAKTTAKSTEKKKEEEKKEEKKKETPKETKQPEEETKLPKETGCRAVSTESWELDAEEVDVTLKSADCGEGTTVKYRVVSEVASEQKREVGRLRGNGEIVRVSERPAEVAGGSKGINSATTGGSKLADIDVWPKSGDLGGAWVVQSGTDNWVMLKYRELREVTGVVVYETLNPGGVTKVELLDEKQNSHMVWTRLDNQPTANWKSARVSTEASPLKDSTARLWKLKFNNPTAFKPLYVKVTVDASGDWRGIDSIRLLGEDVRYPKLPGPLLDNHVIYRPKVESGCDYFNVQASGDDGETWSSPVRVTACYGCPVGPKGEVCAGHGKCNRGRCECTEPTKENPAAWEGHACQLPSCPKSDDGAACSGRGVCGGRNDPENRCACFPSFTGLACKDHVSISHCHFVGDPHYQTFDRKYSAFRTSYNNYNEGEMLDYYMADEATNPDHEAIVSMNKKPTDALYTINSWIGYRKKNDFVIVNGVDDVRLGRVVAPLQRDDGGCFGPNIVEKVRALAMKGKTFVTPDGLEIKYVPAASETDSGEEEARNVNPNKPSIPTAVTGARIEVSSTHPGKNPSGTILFVMENTADQGALDAWIMIQTAKNGKARGMCGNFDGKGDDLGKFWRHGEPTPAVSKLVEVPADSSFLTCKGAMAPIGGELDFDRNELQTMSLLQTGKGSVHVARQLDVDSSTRKWLETGMSEEKASVGDEVKTDKPEDDQSAQQDVEDALRECKGRTTDTATAEQAEWLGDKPWSLRHLALGDCYRQILSKTPIGETTKKMEEDARNIDGEAERALAVLNGFKNEFQDEKSDYIDCLADVCATGRTEAWSDVIDVDRAMNKLAEQLAETNERVSEQLMDSIKRKRDAEREGEKENVEDGKE